VDGLYQRFKWASVSVKASRKCTWRFLSKMLRRIQHQTTDNYRLIKSNAKNISTFQKRRCLHFSEVDIIALSNFRSVGKYCHKQLQLVKITLYWDTSMHCIFCQTTNTNQNLKSGNARAENMEDQEKAIFRTLAIMVGAFTLAVLPTFIVVLTVLPTAK